MVCIRCQKRPAIIFIQRMVDGQMKQEGYCLHCARELHIKPVDDLMKPVSYTHLDVYKRQVKEYHKKTGTTVLLVSHSMEDIAKYANRVLVMSLSLIHICTL